MSNEVALIPSAADWTQMVAMAAALVRSTFLPPTVNTAEKAVAIALKGRELGIPMMQSFAQINVIQGKPAVSAELQLALIYKNVPGAKVEFERYDATGCTVVATRPGHRPAKFTFDKADAEAAGLLGKDNWKKYPRNMYRSRAISEMARSVFPDAIMGCSHTPEELGATVTEDGEIVDVTPVAPETNSPSPQVQDTRPMDLSPQGQKVNPAKPKQPTIFDMNNAALQKTVADILKAKKVDETLWEAICLNLHGKPSTELDNVINTVMQTVS